MGGEPAPVEQGEEERRSFWVVVLLTSYRFYTGFLGATWVPFLVAKEGGQLMLRHQWYHQSLFMGIMKLIYGGSMCLNPFFGLLSDRMASYSGGGRSPFLLIGVAVSGIGIYAAMTASDSGDVSWYCCSTCLWMLGEAMADITTETIAPELLPASQYDMASAVRSIHHILGCLVGYVVLIVAAAGGIPWRWLYVAYFAVMLLCGLPIIVYIAKVRPRRVLQSRQTITQGPYLAAIVEAYMAPTRLKGGFPRACLCMLIFSLGTGPMFFTLLMIRDLVGIRDEKELQMQFSLVSIVFLLSATITAAWSGIRGGGGSSSSAAVTRSGRGPTRTQQGREEDSDASSQHSADEDPGLMSRR